MSRVLFILAMAVMGRLAGEAWIALTEQAARLAQR